MNVNNAFDGLGRIVMNQRTFTVDGDDADTHADYACPIGYVMEIEHAEWSHDNAAARTGYWVLTRGGVPYVLAEPQALNANTRRQMYTDVIMHKPLLMRYGDTLSVIVTLACDAGKNITMQFTVSELKGETA